MCDWNGGDDGDNDCGCGCGDSGDSDNHHLLCVKRQGLGSKVVDYFLPSPCMHV